MLEPVDLKTLLNSDASAPGIIALYQRAMQHRTNEAMNGLSNRLDQIIVQAEKNGRAQGRQQAAMIALTAVLAVATIVYTVTTVYATRETIQAQQASAGSQSRIEYIRSSGAVPESAAVHMGVDEKGVPAVCVNGTAYDVPALGDVRLKERPQPTRPDGAMMPVLRCKD
ncbi:conserved hypothetical protein [Paraburkholderia tropica]|uniref:hypothetical protein n=1 Tax=Paraburkholderia tropica TaxID=92647 RepID=UPI001CADC17E|nr:hypothetical protein [Paraburkholderia tropica]CAG9230207.1 conserved hypothetical protein [Paraburkholderia tropica]